MLLEQSIPKSIVVKTLRSGEQVLVDPEVTAQKLVLAFYALINVGAFFGIATTYAEKVIGYWLAFLLPGIMYLFLPILLFLLYKRLITTPPGGSELSNFFKVIGISIRKNGIRKIGSKGFLDIAKPSNLADQGITSIKGKQITWTDGFVEDVRRTLEACQIFLFLPIYYLNDGGIGSIQSSQGASMTTNGAPNDLLNNFSPLTVIIFIPILSYGIYPLLQRYKIKFGPIKRITFGFLLASVCSVIGAITQYYVYQTSPCGYYATNCTIDSGVSPISIWWQTPQYVLSAASECFAYTTALELAYARAPKNMKSLIMSLVLFSAAVSYAIGEVCTPSLNDPYLIWPFAATAVAGVILAVWFYFLYRHLDDEEFIRDDAGDER
jgi:dipeptide/tripeptide permease